MAERYEPPMMTSGTGVGWRNQLVLVNHRTGSFSICHLTFFILAFGIVDFLFVSVRVISWIVLISRPTNDPRNNTKHHEMTSRK